MRVRTLPDVRVSSLENSRKFSDAKDQNTIQEGLNDRILEVTESYG